MRTVKYYKMAIFTLFVLVSLFILITAISSLTLPDETEVQGSTVLPEIEAEDLDNSISDLKICDDSKLYEDDVEDSIVTMYLIVRQGNSAENTKHLWEEINTYSTMDYEQMGVDKYKAEAILQIGDERGPVQGELGYGVRVPNATVKIRGQTSSAGKQKSYKIKLKDNKGDWNGQRTIVLNKHIYDGIRVRNKLCYDLMKSIPDMLSARTQFVHLYVKDETIDTESEFVDYGLYTQVEQINKTYLKNHGLDKYGHLYKINEFEFRRYDAIKLVNDTEYDKKAFETRIETKGDNDHSKLIAMLEAVNDYSIPIKEVFEEHFDEDNFFTWLAFHILMGNKDTQSRNLYLYSPLNSNTWYFISWDQDASLKTGEDRVRGIKTVNSFEQGVANYWGNVLFQRVLKSEYYRALLDEKIEKLRIILHPERIKEKLASYVAVVKPYIFSMPDIANVKLTESDYDSVIASVPEEVEYNYQDYLESLCRPMPFFLYPPYIKEDYFVYEWGQSFDFNGEEITYTFQLAKDYKFNEIIYEQDDLSVNMIKLGRLDEGQYFMRVVAVNESLKQQMAFDYYRAEDGMYYGEKCFYVLRDGTIEEDSD